MSEVRYIITSSGGVPAPLAAHLLRQAVAEAGGVVIREDSPIEERGVAEVAAAVVTVIASGLTKEAVAAIVRRLRDRGAKADWREDSGYR